MARQFSFAVFVGFYSSSLVYAAYLVAKEEAVCSFCNADITKR